MSHALSKRIILSPLQLQRLLGRDRELTSRTDAARQTALAKAARAAKTIGPAQAYAQYSATQQRHLKQAAQERDAPLELVVSDPTPQQQHPGGHRVENDLIDFDDDNIPPPPPPPVTPKTPKWKPKPKKVPKGVSRDWKKAQSRRYSQHDEDVGPSTPGSTPKTGRVNAQKRTSIWSPIKTRSRTKTKTSPWLQYGKVSKL